MHRLSLSTLRAKAVAQTLFTPTTLSKALKKLRFVQADPIRAPAAAQDLILRHRVANYREGDLSKAYPKLGIEEDFLYAYGYVTRDVWQNIHPRVMKELSEYESRVLEVARRVGPANAGTLDPYFGKKSGINGWGGQSRISKMALESLHHRGLLRISHRRNGIRIYEAAEPPATAVSPLLRLENLLGTITGLLAPVAQNRLATIAAPLARHLPGKDSQRSAVPALIRKLIKEGGLVQGECDGITYLWPYNSVRMLQAEPQVRFLAPFDPLVWDRSRFGHLWGWEYRFEAYTPKHKRIRGYYAMPLLWKDEVIGWGNFARKDKELDIDIGYAGKKPKEKIFAMELEAEIARFRKFLRFE